MVVPPAAVLTGRDVARDNRDVESDLSPVTGHMPAWCHTHTLTGAGLITQWVSEGLSSDAPINSQKLQAMKDRTSTRNVHKNINKNTTATLVAIKTILNKNYHFHHLPLPPPTTT